MRRAAGGATLATFGQDTNAALLASGLAAAARPNVSEIFASFGHMPLGDGQFRVLIAANIGAVIMPWMIFLSGGQKVARAPESRASPWTTK